MNHLEDLLHHVGLRRKIVEQHLKHLTKAVDSDGANPTRERHIATKQRLLDKWVSWERALEAAIMEGTDA